MLGNQALECVEIFGAQPAPLELTREQTNSQLLSASFCWKPAKNDRLKKILRLSAQ
jgi:hypothetical protein